VFESLKGQETSFFPILVRQTLGPSRRPLQSLPETASARVKWEELEADHSPPCSAVGKIGGAIPPLPIRVNVMALN
jgi:hypothetical protein